jgi:hypothetical protein
MAQPRDCARLRLVEEHDVWPATTLTLPKWTAAAAIPILGLLLAAPAGDAAASAAPPAPGASPYAAWKNGPPASPDYFPIAVWLQDPKMAPKYKAAGINLYVGLWEGPTDGQLAALKAAGMPVICEQNATGLKHKDDPTIAGWMHGDEPDNAQSLPSGKGYGPPIPPEKIAADYQRIHAADPTRPVMLNLGQGVAWDGWYGRGVRTNHPEDYPLYVKGGDIVSFDIYPVAHEKREVQGKLEFVARGVERLVGWAGPTRVAWNCIECTRISSERKATPAEVRAEVWMSLIHGSRGLIYFVHEWKPKFNEHALLDDPQMLAGVTAINQEIHALAPVLSSPTVEGAARVTSAPPDVPIAAMVKRSGGAVYVFACAMRGARARGTLAVAGLPAAAQAEVLGEGRTLKAPGGRFQDDFEPYGVHLYRVR